MRIRRLTLVLGVVAVMTTLVAPAAVAETLEHDELPPRITEGITKRCEKVPNKIARIERKIERLEGDAGTPGSIAWVEKWADRFREHGYDDIADLLDVRADLKEDALELAEDALVHLVEVDAWCDEFLDARV